MLGKVPILTADVVCFAADDIFVNYCAEAARIVEEGTATPAQVDAIVNAAIGGGGPFNVMDLTKGNLLNIHCLELMRDAETGGKWFEPPPIFAKQANTPWHDRKNPGDPTHDEALKNEVLDRILAVIIGRTYFVIDNDICAPGAFNWLTQVALGYRGGLLELAEELGAERCKELVEKYAARFEGFEVSKSLAAGKLVDFYRTIVVETEGDLGQITICRPEAMNALSDKVMGELEDAFAKLDANVAI